MLELLIEVLETLCEKKDGIYIYKGLTFTVVGQSVSIRKGSALPQNAFTDPERLEKFINEYKMI